LLTTNQPLFFLSLEKRKNKQEQEEEEEEEEEKGPLHRLTTSHSFH